MIGTKRRHRLIDYNWFLTTVPAKYFLEFDYNWPYYISLFFNVIGTCFKQAKILLITVILHLMPNFSLYIKQCFYVNIVNLISYLV